MSVNLDKLVQKQLALREQIQKAAINHSKAGKARKTQGYLTTRLSVLSKVWEQFSINHITIWENKGDTELEYFSNDIYENTEEAYFELLANLNERLDEFNQKSSLQNITQSKVKLPPIAIPKFDGNYKSWRSFHDLFTSLIDSDHNLSNVQKLHYLKTNVAGEAERLLRQFEVLDCNYEKAWELLTKRYNNKRALVNHQLKALLSQPQIKVETSTSLKTFLDQIEESIHELQALELPIYSWDAILLHILVQKLPQETHYHWEQELREKSDLPTYKEFTKFLETRFRTLEALTEENKVHPPKTTYGLFNEFKSSSPNHKAPTAKQKFSCNYCRESHSIIYCPTFKKLNVHQRHDVVTKKQLCKNCLASSHITTHCPSNKNCYLCNKRHNTLLHYQQTPNTSVPRNYTTQEFNFEPNHGLSHDTPTQKTSEQQVQSFFTTSIQRALLSTALVNITTPSGVTMTFRALIDSGSQMSIMTENAFKQLQLTGSPTNHKVIGLGSTYTNTALKQTAVTISSIYSNFKIKANMLVIKKITDPIPAQTVNVSSWKHIQNLPLADPTLETPGEIDILLGADIYARIIANGLKRGSNKLPIAQNTKLGWILMGTIPETKKVLITHSSSKNISTHMAAPEIIISKCKQTEGMPKNSSSLSSEPCTPKQFKLLCLTIISLLFIWFPHSYFFLKTMEKLLQIFKSGSENELNISPSSPIRAMVNKIRKKMEDFRSITALLPAPTKARVVDSPKASVKPPGSNRTPSPTPKRMEPKTCSNIEKKGRLPQSAAFQLPSAHSPAVLFKKRHTEALPAPTSPKGSRKAPNLNSEEALKLKREETVYNPGMRVPNSQRLSSARRNLRPATTSHICSINTTHQLAFKGATDMIPSPNDDMMSLKMTRRRKRMEIAHQRS